VNNEPTWATGTRSKHWREAATILAELLEAAYFADKCSANDIKSRELISESNVIGAVFKRLRGCGLVQTNERIEPTWKQAHSRPLYVWRVVDRALLAEKIEQVRDLLGVGVEANGQGKLAM